MAEIIDISYNALRHYETDISEPSISTLTNIATALNVTSDSLLDLKLQNSLTAQNSDESELLRSYRDLSQLWRNRVITHISWLAEMATVTNHAGRLSGEQSRH